MSNPPTRTLKPMVGVVVVSHEQVAFSMLEAARRVVGTLPGVRVACASAARRQRGNHPTGGAGLQRGR